MFQMKLTQNIFTLFLLYFAVVGFAFSQNKSLKEKNEKAEQKTLEVKANVMVLDAENKFIDDIKVEDLRIFEDGVEQKITRFAKRPEKLNLGIIVDNSGSMRYVLNEIISIGKSIVSNLQEDDEAFIIRFVSSDEIEVGVEWTSDKTKLKAAIDNMYISGGASAIADAIYLSGGKLLEREKKDKMKKYALVVISDGEDRDSYYRYKEMLSLFKNTDVQVLMLSYNPFESARKPEATLKFGDKIAFETGGAVVNLPKKRTKEDVIAALKAIISELRSQYVIGYSSTNPKRDGRARALRVIIADGKNGEKRNGLIKQSFVPIK